MNRPTRRMRTALASLGLAAACGLAGATSVSSGGSGSAGTLTDLGLFAAGTYALTGSGFVDLVGDNSFLINADGSRSTRPSRRPATTTSTRTARTPPTATTAPPAPTRRSAR